MESAHDAIAAHAFVILHEIKRTYLCFKISLRKTLKKKPRGSLNSLGSIIITTGMEVLITFILF